jgi:hypothetical protein
MDKMEDSAAIPKQGHQRPESEQFAGAANAIESDQFVGNEPLIELELALVRALQRLAATDDGIGR